MEVLENEVQYEITKKRLEFTEKTLNDFKANSNNLNEEDLELQLSILGSRIEEFKELIYLYENIKIASSNIFLLEDNQIFVFGSNLSGRHGLGAAKTAMQWGAKYGQAEGLQGQTYAIPTVNSLVTKKLPLHEIETYVNNFIKFAKDNPDKDFLVTEIGCGLAGYYPTEIAPFFKKAVGVKNIHLPIEFIQVLYDKFNF
jgi:lantibiotic modifying enzyme